MRRKRLWGKQGVRCSGLWYRGQRSHGGKGGADEETYLPTVPLLLGTTVTSDDKQRRHGEPRRPRGPPGLGPVDSEPLVGTTQTKAETITERGQKTQTVDVTKVAGGKTGGTGL